MLPWPWGRVRLQRSGEASKAAGVSVVTALGMGCALPCLEQTLLINKSRAVNKPTMSTLLQSKKRRIFYNLEG